jgi:hypothetical protein
MEKVLVNAADTTYVLPFSKTYMLRSGAHPEFFLGGGGVSDPVAVYNLCLILKVIL